MISGVWKHEQDLTDKGILMLLPEHIRELLEVIIQEGFILTLVGGAVRDYFLTGAFSRDLDFELRHSREYNEQQWIVHIEHLKEHLQQTYGHLGHKIEFLSFSIIRIGWEDHEEEIELAPARIESYDESEGLGHSDLDVTFVSHLDYAKTFARRDFTLNAMGIEFCMNKTDILVHFIDPYFGLRDLIAKELIPCGDNFSKDPVRFCRAIRFSLRYELKFSPQLCDTFKAFNLYKLSTYYLFKEALKVDFFRFVDIFFEWIKRARIPLSQDLSDLSFLTQTGQYNLGLSTLDEVLLFLIYHKHSKGESICIQDIEYFTKVAKLKLSLVAVHTNLKEALEELSNVAIEQIRSDIRKLSFSEFLNYPYKAALKHFHVSINRNCNREQLLFVLAKINSPFHGVVLEYLDLLPKDLGGKAEFLKMINEQGFVPEQRSYALYYCHFMSL